MVLSFFRSGSGPGDLDHIATRSVAMLADAHHSFELATTSLLTDAAIDALAQDVRDTDRRINRAEQELRSDLVVHVSMNRSADIASVLGFTLLVKKIERVGDHCKNILELTENGVSLADVPETEALKAEREVISALFTRAAELLGTPDPETGAVQDYVDSVHSVIADCQARIDSYMGSDRPGREVVPLAIYYRYLRRIAANLLGVVRAYAEPMPSLDLPAADDQVEDDSAG